MHRTFVKNNVTADAELIPDAFSVRIKVRPIGGFLRWQRPDSAALRKLADETIKESAYPSFVRKDRARVVGTETGWNIFYRVGD